MVLPELYKNFARFLSNDVGYTISPNALYFLINNYTDGLTRIIHNGYNTYLTLTGSKDFDPKTDLMIFDSYFGRKSNVDSRDYSEQVKKIKEMQGELNMRKSDPKAYIQYVKENPYAEILVKLYNKNEGGDLKKLRTEANVIRGLPSSVASPKEKKEVVDKLILMQNFIKRGFVDTVKVYTD